MKPKKRSWLDRLINGPERDPYEKGSIRCWKHHHFDQWFKAPTISGFSIDYRLRGWIDRVDDAAFKAARMLDDGAADRLLNEYFREHVQPIIMRSGFFWLDDIDYKYEGGRFKIGCRVRRYRFSSFEPLTAEFDANCCGTIEAINSVPFLRHGCRFVLILMDRALLDHRIEENFNMLSPEELANVVANRVVARAHESMVVIATEKVNATFKRLLGHQTDQSYGGEFVEVSTRCVHHLVEIEWRLRSDVRPRQFTVLGFRKTGGFDQDKFSESANGIRVIDSVRAGKIVEALQPGETYYYTVFLKSQERKVDRFDDPIRFTVRVPTRQEIAMASGGRRPNARDAEIEQMIASLDTEMQKREALRNYKTRAVATIKASGLLPDQEKEEVESLEDAIERARTTYF